ncbi:MAG TPA: S41 family peptidase [Tepidisphaeraceae bacterium]|jgi:hypothetical protein|nr:S41 family peptidase [Tepidisphaeraceae bacterium]
MRCIPKIVFICVIGGLSALSLAAAPKVVKASPDNGQKDVDPATAELRIVFDQAMSPGGRSIVNSSRGILPELVDRPRWENERTFVWKMKLEPNTDYWLSINSTRFTNFRSKAGESAEPYVIAFSTGAGANAKPASPEMIKANREAMARLKKAILEDYSYVDLRKIDWQKQFAEFAPRLESAGGPAEFANTAGKLLAVAQDVHLAMRAGDRRIVTWKRDVFPAMNFELMKSIPMWMKRHNFVYSGMFSNGARYLCITSLPADDAAFLLAIYEVIGDAAQANAGLIMDLRLNGGGDELTARKIAGCFLDKPAVYAGHVMRSGGKFSERQTRTVAPNPAGPKFRGKVIVLTGPGTVSSCEALVLMMKQAPGCVVVGQKTAGSSGNPKIFDLGNGTSVSVPQWKAMRPDGTVFEGEGIAPDVEVQAKPADFEREDPILAEGLKRAGG